MAQLRYAQSVISMTEFKKDPLVAVAAGKGEAVAVLKHNKPAFYCVPTDLYESMIECIEDQKLIDLVTSRRDEPAVSVKLDDL